MIKSNAKFTSDIITCRSSRYSHVRLTNIRYNNVTHPSDHYELRSLKCHLVFFPDRSQVLLPCSMLLCTQLLYSLPLLINDISLL